MTTLPAFRHWISILTLAMGLIYAQLSFGHHGWGWATDEEYEITGEVTDLRLGNPHGELTLNVDGSEWTVEVGQPWRNDRVGLSPELLQPGATITAHGHRSAKQGELLLKAERIVINGKDYNLYPDRDS